jgi:hypothetical protein
MNWGYEVLWAMVTFVLGVISLTVALLGWALVALVFWGVWTFMASGGL